jgi:hypothetical protein
LAICSTHAGLSVRLGGIYAVEQLANPGFGLLGGHSA